MQNNILNFSHFCSFCYTWKEFPPILSLLFFRADTFLCLDNWVSLEYENSILCSRMSQHGYRILREKGMLQLQRERELGFKSNGELRRFLEKQIPSKKNSLTAPENREYLWENDSQLPIVPTQCPSPQGATAKGQQSGLAVRKQVFRCMGLPALEKINSAWSSVTIMDLTEVLPPSYLYYLAPRFVLGRGPGKLRMLGVLPKVMTGMWTELSVS